MVLAAPVPTLVTMLFVARWDGVVLAGGLGAALVAAGPARRMLGLPSRFADAAVIAGLAALFEATCIACTGDVRALALLAAGVAGRCRRTPPPRRISRRGQGVWCRRARRRPRRSGTSLSYLAIAPANRVAMRSVISAGTTGVVVVVTALVLCWAAGRVVTASDPAAPARPLDRRRTGRALRRSLAVVQHRARHLSRSTRLPHRPHVGDVVVDGLRDRPAAAAHRTRRRCGLRVWRWSPPRSRSSSCSILRCSAESPAYWPSSAPG